MMTNHGRIFIQILALSISQLSAAQTITEQQSAALKVITETAASICTTPPLEHTSQNASLTVDAKAKLNSVISKIADIGAGASGTIGTSTSTGVLEKDLATALAQGNDCKVTVLKSLVDKMVPSLGKQQVPTISTASSIEEVKTVNGSFKREGSRWIEYPPFAPGTNFTFQEARRDANYIYLYDPSRTKNGDPNNPMMVRLPTNGGAVQWSYTNPIVWTDFTLALAPGK